MTECGQCVQPEAANPIHAEWSKDADRVYRTNGVWYQNGHALSSERQVQLNRRQNALEKLKAPEFSEEEAISETRYVANKLKITYEELIKYRDMKKKYYYDYPHSLSLFQLGAKFMQKFGLEAGIKR